jgi:hypothetical protein
MERHVELSKALYVLAMTHTRDDDVTGFVVMAGASPHYPVTEFGVQDYMDAWKAVREHVHLQTEPAT